VEVKLECHVLRLCRMEYVKDGDVMCCLNHKHRLVYVYVCMYVCICVYVYMYVCMYFFFY